MPSRGLCQRCADHSLTGINRISLHLERKNCLPSLLSDDEEELDEKEVDNNGTDYAVS